MKVSVSLITYNHAQFIRQAIEGALMQKTNFDYEILLGEDDSNDGTRQIAQEYADKFPNRIRLFLHNRKDVLYVNGQPTGRKNLVHTLKNARGQYIAMLEGDDYWTSPDKLQKQVDFLDRHPDYSFCFHDVQVVYQDGSPSHPFPFPSRAARFTLSDFLQKKANPITCGVMFRNGLFKDFPDWFYRSPVGDLALYVLHAQHGDFGFMDECMAVYRIHRGGMWTQGGSPFNGGSAATRVWSSETKRKRYASLLETHESINAHLGYKYDSILRKEIARFCYDLAWLYQCERDWTQMRSCLRKALKNSPFPKGVSKSYIFKAWLIAAFPQLYQAYTSRKRLPDTTANSAAQ